MAKLCVRSFALSIDGYGAGPDQDLQNPLGVRGAELMRISYTTTSTASTAVAEASHG